MKLTTQLHLAPRFRMHDALSHGHQYGFMVWCSDTGITFLLLLLITLYHLSQHLCLGFTLGDMQVLCGWPIQTVWQICDWHTEEVKVTKLGTWIISCLSPCKPCPKLMFHLLVYDWYKARWHNCSFMLSENHYAFYSHLMDKLTNKWAVSVAVMSSGFACNVQHVWH
jgi:hypothetical protein